MVLSRKDRHAALVRAAEDLARTPSYWAQFTGGGPGYPRCLLTHVVGPHNLYLAAYPWLNSQWYDVERRLELAGFTDNEIDTVLQINDGCKSVEDMLSQIRNEFG